MLLLLLEVLCGNVAELKSLWTDGVRRLLLSPVKELLIVLLFATDEVEASWNMFSRSL